MKRIVILTGAGISAESGIPTFRDSEGLWSKYKIEDVATFEAFQRNPQLVQNFYNERRRELLIGKIKPNSAHTALTRLQKEFKGSVYLITQNIDNLHELSGSQSVVHMHGELLKSRCMSCEKLQICESDLNENTICNICKSKGMLRPHVVWFGEIPLRMDEIYRELSLASLFISIGTSGNVYPAAGFVRHAKYEAGAKTVEINMEPSCNYNLFDEKLLGKATEIVPQYVDEILKEKF